MSKTYTRPVRLRLRPSTLSTHVAQKRQEQKDVEQQEQQQALETQSAEVVKAQEKRTQQIKELLRLCALMRADVGLSEVLRQIAGSIASCTGFRMSVICLLTEGDEYVSPVAFAGASEESEQLIRQHPISKAQMYRLMHPQYLLSQSYFIPHDCFQREFADIVVTTLVRADGDGAEEESRRWHPQDIFITPLLSPNKQQVFGFISLDEPEDDTVPTLESTEVIELFANQAAIAIENARLFQERENERLALEQGIVAMREDIEQIRSGDLHVHVRSTHPLLEQVSEAINSTVTEMRSIVGDVWAVTQAVNEHTRNVQHNSTMLARDTSQQGQLTQRISQVFETVITMMKSVSIDAGKVLSMIGDEHEIAQAGQQSVDRSVEGMGKIRDTTMQMARSIKRLSESGQEISDTMMGVGDMSARLHIIALNAAIEAARAGEQGQGFAMVAQELRGLSQTCSEASRKINSFIRTIQQETIFASQHMEQNTHHVVMQNDLVAQTSIALEAIQSVTQEMTTVVQTMTTTAEHQAQGADHISSAVREMTQTTGEINALMQETNRSMDHLVALSDALRTRIERLYTGEVRIEE